MATSTYSAALAHDIPAKNGFFTKVAQRFVAQRTAKARALTATYLSSVSDAQLVSYGWSAEDIKRLRNFG